MTILEHHEFAHLYVSQHPLIQHKLSLLRDVKTDRMQFKALVDELTTLLVYECCHGLEITHTRVDTPLTQFDAPVLTQTDYVILPILRAGLGMVDGFLRLLPNARVGHIGLYRDESSLEPQQYYFKIPPKASQQHFFICDPMLATGGSVCHTIKTLHAAGIHKLSLVTLVTAPEGVRAVREIAPQLPIFTASLDEKLNDKGYIMPGLGDAGDRLFGTL